MARFKRRGKQTGNPTPSGPPRGPRPAPPPRSAPTPAKPVFQWRSYDIVADEYDRTHAPYTAVVAADLLSAAEPGPDARVLDVGTGTGRVVAAAQQTTGDAALVFGVDESPAMLRLATSRRVAAAEVINLPFRNDAFHIVLSNFSLAYFAKLETALFDMRRVLKPGGRIAASSWGADEDDLSKTWRTLLEETIGRDILKAGLKDESPWAEKLADRGRLETVLRDAGFRPVTVERRRYRFQVPREDYIIGHEVEASGRYARAMLGESLWPSFQKRIRAIYAERFPEQLVDFRDVLLATGVKP